MHILNTIGKKYTEEAKQILNTLGHVDYKIITQEELIACISVYDVVFCGLGLHFNKDVLDNARNLRCIVTSTTGTDHIDVAYAKEKGIEVISLKDDIEFLKTITSTAELSFGLLIDLARGISRSFASVKQYEWERERFRGMELRGKTLGIVGYGRLGQLMARYGQAFSMNVVVSDPFVSDEFCYDMGVTRVSYQELLSQSDVISLHVHLNADTEKMVSTAAFEIMKPTALLINTARGKVVDEEALLIALEQKRLAGYATDVLDGEVLFQESFTFHPLVAYAQTHDTVVITPHIGGMTHESRSRTDVFAAQKLQTWIQNNKAL